ncbi:MAG: NAD(P)-binding domain-containing protein, partial [Solobacterium sp.]|nr:NAD(P)-binding domain-containing protein [Solobacterium sp.]
MKIGILGATGAVGRQMLECIEERNIACDELRLLASSRSAGKAVKFKDSELIIQEAKDSAFAGLDFVLGAVEAEFAKEFAPAIKQSGAVFIDNSSSFRLNPDVPLVVPEINGEDALHHNGIISNPNCSTIITLMAVAPI